MCKNSPEKESVHGVYVVLILYLTKITIIMKVTAAGVSGQLPF